jgi:hypothetical protein
MTRLAFALAFAFAFSGCGVVRHRYVIEPIKVMPSGGGLAKISLLGGGGAKVEEKCPEKCADNGNWFVRRVYQPDMGKDLIYSVELLYCPTDKMNFNDCRVAVAWTRGSGKGGIGLQEGAPPSPVPEGAPQMSGGAAPSGGGGAAPSGGGAAAAGGGVGSESDIIDVKGRTYFDLSGAEVAQIRGWIGKVVSVTLTYGKTVSGTLGAVDGSGINLDRSGKTSHYRWDEVSAVFAGR